MANRQKLPIFEAMCSLMAQASPKPSYVDVPLPSSSIMMSDFSVAELEAQNTEVQTRFVFRLCFFRVRGGVCVFTAGWQPSPASLT